MTKQLPRLETVKTVPPQLQATALARPPSHCKAAPIAAVPLPVLGLNGLGPGRFSIETPVRVERVPVACPMGRCSAVHHGRSRARHKSAHLRWG